MKTIFLTLPMYGVAKGSAYRAWMEIRNSLLSAPRLSWPNLLTAWFRGIACKDFASSSLDKIVFAPCFACTRRFPTLASCSYCCCCGDVLLKKKKEKNKRGGNPDKFHAELWRRLEIRRAWVAVPRPKHPLPLPCEGRLLGSERIPVGASCRYTPSFRAPIFFFGLAADVQSCD